MSKNKLRFILFLICVFIVGSGIVYYDQTKNSSQKHQASLSLQKKANKEPSTAQLSNIDNSKNKDEAAISTSENVQNVDNSTQSYEIVKTVSEDADYVYIKYRLKSGDHLWSLAEHFMPTYKTLGVVTDIQQHNSFKNNNLLSVGNSIVIPAEKSVLKTK
ncbi:uncharacterized protein HemX [Clostridium acetobutylicum]|uniref:Protein containing LysM motif repeat n=1 Tax=Clostridium acetobutylicum (strain ATCC 824 / DSM 792 / JCM 1419 / IAM 19013 / LMG 5710 / NBRC 13948 / NRRL B-527 / VKM B-1787 / 2291 / W) TaxID=272562 RepID=Q97MI4_CLOAB|nr:MULTISPECIES: LysM domain-containing protein [Clostridium]AAK78195.1 Protein containing LysM motif repeat [Clostridium acetobutylicum ATCC 824]ADZ19259.1 Protein containing LysM motif repeat [Clostridium acetobutylicum EA 2018]AEI31117.1 LysM motif-containing protein [Clostridium acetobutylicum DSM 1731]AWV82002.1 LysM domain-containing protein [Clostridium acetobutylicum]MBC2395929.1 LysM peptidoglycan-binding domain-containing protein [Clostridium acetobutylicum]